MLSRKDICNILLNNVWFSTNIKITTYQEANSILDTFVKLNLTSTNILSILDRIQKTYTVMSVSPDTLPQFYIYKAIAEDEVLYKLLSRYIPKFPYLADIKTDEDVFIMAKVYVETAYIKYSCITPEFYYSLPYVLSSIVQYYNQSSDDDKESMYSFEEHCLKCILKYNEDVSGSEFDDLISCIINNPYLSSLPLSDILTC